MAGRCRDLSFGSISWDPPLPLPRHPTTLSRQVTCGLSTVNEVQIAARGARLARRADREYREYSREKQAQAGCPAREVVLDHRGQATTAAGY